VEEMGMYPNLLETSYYEVVDQMFGEIEGNKWK
jgi:hypothetical protein